MEPMTRLRRHSATSRFDEDGLEIPALSRPNPLISNLAARAGSTLDTEVFARWAQQPWILYFRLRQ